MALDLIIEKKIYEPLKKYIQSYVTESEIKHNAIRESYWYRDATPTDLQINQYRKVFKTGAFTEIAKYSVPTHQTHVSIGWYSKTYLGDEGQLVTRRNAVTSSVVLNDMVLRSRDPDHYFYMPSKIMVAHENDIIKFEAYNNLKKDTEGVIYPLVMVIGLRDMLMSAYGWSPSLEEGQIDILDQLDEQYDSWKYEIGGKKE